MHNPSVLLERVKQALYALYHPHEQPKQHAHADQFLRELTVQVEAWEVAGNLLLHSQNFEERFFGAQILFLKLGQQWTSLNKQQQMQIRDLIVTSILSSPPKIAEKLCQSLAIYTLKKIVGSSAELTINSLFSTFSLANVVMDYVNEQPQQTQQSKTVFVVQPFLIWIAQIAEQTAHPSFESHEIAKISNGLNKVSDQIIDFVLKVLQNSKNPATQKLALTCLLKWVENGIPVEKLFKDVLEAAFTTIHVSHLFEESAALINEAVTIRSETKYNDFVRRYISRVISLAPLYKQAVKTQMYQVCREITKIAAGLGETHIELIMGSSVGAEGFELIQFILMTCRADYAQCQLTGEFWYNLSNHLTNSPVDSQTKAKLLQIYSEFLTILISKLSLTEENADDEDFISFRRESSDLLNAVYSVLYDNYLNICFNGVKQGLLQYQKTGVWQLIEASLFAVSNVHEYIRDAQYPSLVPIIQMFNDLPSGTANGSSQSSDLIELKSTQVELLGNYASFCGKQSEDFLSHAINFVLSAVIQFTVLKLDQRNQAVDAFCSLCERCAERNLENLAKNLIQTFTPKLGELTDYHVQTKIMEGLSSIVFGITAHNRGNEELQFQLLYLQIQPTIAKISHKATQVTNHDVVVLVNELFKIRALVKAFDGERSFTVVLKLIQHLWKLLLELLAHYKKYDAVVEAMAKLYECFACSVGVHPETLDLMNSITIIMYELYYELLYPCALKVITTVTYGLAMDTSVFRSLLNHYPRICQTTFEHAEQLLTDDRLIIEFFNLQYSIMESYPQLFVASIELAELVMTHAVECIQFRSTEVAHCMTRFFSEFLQFGTKNQQFQQQFVHLLQHTSPLLIPVLLKTVLFEEHPGTRFFFKIFQSYRNHKRFLTTFTDNLIRYDQTIPSLQLVPQAYRNSFANQLATSTTLNKIRQVIEDFKIRLVQQEQQQPTA